MFTLLPDNTPPPPHIETSQSKIRGMLIRLVENKQAEVTALNAEIKKLNVTRVNTLAQVNRLQELLAYQNAGVPVIVQVE